MSVVQAIDRFHRSDSCRHVALKWFTGDGEPEDYKGPRELNSLAELCVPAVVFSIIRFDVSHQCHQEVRRKVKDQTTTTIGHYTTQLPKFGGDHIRTSECTTLTMSGS